MGTQRVLMVLGLAVLGHAADAQVVEYYHLDAVGNVRVMTDSSGTAVERHDYMPFGEECATGPCASNPGVAGGQTRKFTGKERDQETGYDYFGARYYGSKTGRFITIDPVYTWRENLEDPQCWNRYAYGRNNPFRFVDPDGRELRTAELARMQEIAGPAGHKIAIVNGKVDVSGLTSGDLANNEGATLIQELATSTSVYSYTEAANAQSRGGSQRVPGISNLDSQADARLSYRKGGQKVAAELPPVGIDASITLNPAAKYVSDPAGQPVTTAALAFHELAEAQGRIDRGMQYQRAHAQAATREQTLVQQRPSFTQGLAGGPVKRTP